MSHTQWLKTMTFTLHTNLQFSQGSVASSPPFGISWGGWKAEAGAIHSPTRLVVEAGHQSEPLHVLWASSQHGGWVQGQVLRERWAETLSPLIT